MLHLLSSKFSQTLSKALISGENCYLFALVSLATVVGQFCCCLFLNFFLRYGSKRVHLKPSVHTILHGHNYSLAQNVDHLWHHRRAPP